MIRIRNVSYSLVFAVLAILAPSGAEATPIPLAAGTPKQGLTIPGVPETGHPGTLLDWVSSSFLITKPGKPDIAGTFVSAVYQNAGGFLDFYYQVVNSSIPVVNADQGLSGVSGFNFGSATTAVGYYDSASLFSGVFAAPNGYPGTRPFSADRTADGNIVTMWFGPPWGSNKIHPGETSSVLMVATNATSYSKGWAEVQNTASTIVRAFQVPEPATFGLLAMGMALAATVRRRQTV